MWSRMKPPSPPITEACIWPLITTGSSCASNTERTNAASAGPEHVPIATRFFMPLVSHQSYVVWKRTCTDLRSECGLGIRTCRPLGHDGERSQLRGALERYELDARHAAVHRRD